MALRRSNDDLVAVQARHLTVVVAVHPGQEQHVEHRREHRADHRRGVDLQHRQGTRQLCAADPFTDFAAFADCGPSTNADVAMALVWAFVAGFGEKLVPNVLDRFIAPTPVA